MVATTLPVFGSTTTDVLLQPEKMRFDALSYAMPVGPSTRRERPRGGRLPRLDVDHLDRVLAFVVDEDVSFAIGRSAFGRGVFELDGGDDVTALWIDRGESADRAAVIRQNDLVVGLIVHDAVETAGPP